jgi:hypothetical protein
MPIMMVFLVFFFSHCGSYWKKFEKQARIETLKVHEMEQFY